ncbi:MAG: hypothetical protein JWL84_4700, partial [Rhodospirillales bacterium]|nr:hypothetical protein [Rhodospirillales bacterium]
MAGDRSRLIPAIGPPTIKALIAFVLQPVGRMRKVRRHGMAYFLQQLINGLTLGSI